MILCCLAAGCAAALTGLGAGTAAAEELAQLPAGASIEPSATANASANAATLPERRQQLCQLLQQGDAAAAGGLVSLGCFDEIAEIDPRPARFASWMSRRDPVGAFSSQQLYGIVLENWASHHATALGNLALATHLRARAFMQPRESLEPMLLFQFAQSLVSWQPTDPARARERFLLGLLMLPERAHRDADLAMLCQAALTAVLGEWKEQGGLMTELDAACARRGDPSWSARAAQVHAVSALHHSPPQVRLALAAYAAAAEDAASAHDDVARARSLMGEAQCLQPERNPDGSLHEAIPLYAEAAGLFERHGLFESQALAQQAQAEAVRPDHDRQGSWDEARRLYLSAAEAFHASGDAPSHADCLASAARAATQNDPLRTTDASRRLLREAMQAYREIGNDAAAEALSEWFNPSQPSR
jgi:hypothetical protein